MNKKQLNKMTLTEIQHELEIIFKKSTVLVWDNDKGITLNLLKIISDKKDGGAFLDIKDVNAIIEAKPLLDRILELY